MFRPHLYITLFMLGGTKKAQAEWNKLADITPLCQNVAFCLYDREMHDKC